MRNENESKIERRESNGNRLLSRLGEAETLYRVGVGNRVLEDSEFFYEHDPEGNLVKRSSKREEGEVTTFEYDHANRLVRSAAWSVDPGDPRAPVDEAELRRDEEYAFRARHYDGGLGRFTGIDPLEFGAGDANLFRFLANSPVNLRDPSGTRIIDYTANGILASFFAGSLAFCYAVDGSLYVTSVLLFYLRLNEAAPGLPPQAAGAVTILYVALECAITAGS